MKKENLINRVKRYLVEVKGELKKVTWPSKPDMYKTTIAVVVSSLIFGIYLFVVDFGFSNLFNSVIDLFN